MNFNDMIINITDQKCRLYGSKQCCSYLLPEGLDMFEPSGTVVTGIGDYQHNKQLQCISN